MTNLEFYEQWFEDHKTEMLAGSLAVSKTNLHPALCEKTKCDECLFGKESHITSCPDLRLKWLGSEYINPSIDLTKLKVDDKILISRDGICWYKRYFAGISDKGRVLTWNDGRTSWSQQDTCEWPYVKLPEDSED